MLNLAIDSKLRASGERWIAKHPGTFLYSLEDAFALRRGSTHETSDRSWRGRHDRELRLT